MSTINTRVTTAIPAIKKVSGNGRCIVDRLYASAGIEQPVYIGVERRASCTRCDIPRITEEHIAANTEEYAMYKDTHPQYIVEEVALTYYITIQYTYTRED